MEIQFLAKSLFFFLHGCRILREKGVNSRKDIEKTKLPEVSTDFACQPIPMQAANVVSQILTQVLSIREVLQIVYTLTESTPKKIGVWISAGRTAVYNFSEGCDLQRVPVYLKDKRKIKAWIVYVIFPNIPATNSVFR